MVSYTPMKYFLIIFISSAFTYANSSQYCNIFYHDLKDFLGCLEIPITNTSNEFDRTEYCSEQQARYILTGSYSFLVSENCTLKPGLFHTLSPQKPKTFISMGETNELLDYTFHGICQARNILLSDNNIKKIHPKAFDCTTSVSIIDLSRNQLDHLPEYLFKDMYSLQMLSLNENRIHTLTEESFFGPNLVLLYLQKNKLQNVSELAFRNSPVLTKLTLGGHPQMVLKSKLFADLTRLEHLELQGCNISFLPDDIFKSNTKLKTLDLTNNRIQSIKPADFNTLRQMEELSLSFNEIFLFESDIFSENINLQKLYLSNNKISRIRKFTGLLSLELLDLSENLINDIAGIEHMKRLQLLNMSYNHLISFPGFKSFTNQSILKIIDLSYNHLTDISDMYWQDLRNLDQLNLTDNAITQLLIPKMHYYPVIHLERNKIKSIFVSPENLENHSLASKKAIFHLSGNELQCDCSIYELYMLLNGSNSLKNIDFAQGLICNSPASQRGKPLNTINSGDFNCESCPENCLCNLNVYNYVRKEINCSHQNRDIFPFVSPADACLLYVQGNKLKSLEGLNNSCWENLIEIHADSNNIIAEEFDMPKKLKFLGIKDNNLTTLPQTIRDHAGNVTDFEMTLSNNPWKCNCEIIPLKNFLIQYQKRVRDADEVKCTFPHEKFSAINLINMQNSELCPQPILLMDPQKKYAIFISVSLLFVCLFLGIYYKNKKNIYLLLFTNFNGCYRLVFQNQLDDEEKPFDCFISYGFNDCQVALQILEEFETKSPKYSVCIHERDWIPGELITTNISLSVENSRKTLIILTKEFAESQWFSFEFQTAYNRSLMDRKNRLIFVVKGEMPGDEVLDKDVQHVLSTVTYLTWGERWFWEKLRYALNEQKPFTVPDKTTIFQRIYNFVRKKNTVDQTVIPEMVELKSIENG